MKLFFAKSGWKTGVSLLLSLIISGIITSISALHNWLVLGGVFTLVFLALLLTALLFGFTAKIGTWGRALWLMLLFSFIGFLAIRIWLFLDPNSID